MVHGILQFTPSIAFHYVLHRCESLDIRCRESFLNQIRTHFLATRSANGTGRRWHHFSSIPWRIPRRGSFCEACAPTSVGNGRHRCHPHPCCSTSSLVVCVVGFDNDPSAGSPTETLLRLLLPLNDKVQWTSRDVAGSEPPTSPRSEHFTGSFNR